MSREVTRRCHTLLIFGGTMENSDERPKCPEGVVDVPVEAAPVVSTPVPRPLELAQGSGGQAAPEPKPSRAESIDTEHERKMYLLGFMPHGEIGGLVLGDLAEHGGIDRVHTLWLPRVEAANRLRQQDERIIDDARLNRVVREIDPALAPKLAQIEARLQKIPFWRNNQHSICLVRLDDLIVLQNCVNLDRAERLAAGLKPGVEVAELLDYAIDFDRKPSPIHHRWIENNTLLFSSPNHDVRPGQIEVRSIPRYRTADLDQAPVPALILPMLEGDSFIYCVRTFSVMQFPDGSQRRNWFLTLQNGVHRAYALRSMGFEYMPMLIVDPRSSDETALLTGNWSPERLQQAYSSCPPLLRDFFNPELTETFSVRRSTLCIRVAVTVEKFTT